MPHYIANEPKAGQAYHVEPGIYEIEVVKAVEKLSQSGNEMIVLTCRVKLPGGGDGPDVNEYLVFTDKASWKIDQVRAACGQAVVPGEETMVMPEDFDGATATVELGDEPGTTNPDARFNKIERWLLPADAKKAAPGPNPAPKAAAKPAAKAAQEEELGDEIPF